MQVFCGIFVFSFNSFLLLFAVINYFHISTVYECRRAVILFIRECYNTIILNNNGTMSVVCNYMTYFVMCCYAIYIWPQDHKLKLDFNSKYMNDYEIFKVFKYLQHLNESCIIGLCSYVLKKNVSQNNIFFLFLWSLVQFKTIYFTCIVCKSVLQPID